MQRFYIIGMSDDHRQYFSPDVMAIISRGKIFSGGKRHHEIVSPLLSPEAKWIDITVPLNNVFTRYEEHPEIVVFASGDPLFFGFANTVKRKLPSAEIILFPSFNSLQMLAHRMVLPYQDMRTISLTGRPWDAFYSALINGEKLLGVLTDREKTPSHIAARMLEYGYNNYQMTVGEALGNREEEQVRTLSLEEASQTTFRFPNCLILEQTSPRPRPFGIPEGEFHLLDGRSKMITKMPIRLLTLSMLGLRDKQSFWDVGFCTGSVSIEAKLQFPDLKVTAFEQRPEGRELMERNSRKFGTPGITALIGDFLETDLSGLPAPDAVFIGGHGGKMIGILQKIDSVLLPGGVIVFNSVSEESLRLFREGIGRIGRKITGSTRITVDSFNTIEIMKAE
ncbi:precorrin-6y C5,15-methyltransferase (decarboxylating) subunit CbiE [Phocaeicola sp.]